MTGYKREVSSDDRPEGQSREWGDVRREENFGFSKSTSLGRSSKGSADHLECREPPRVFRDVVKGWSRNWRGGDRGTRTRSQWEGGLCGGRHVERSETTTTRKTGLPGREFPGVPNKE